MEAEVEHQQPLDIQSVYAAITGAFSLQAPVRTAAEASLKSWEADAVPGFLAALLNIFEHSNDEARSVSQSLRRARYASARKTFVSEKTLLNIYRSVLRKSHACIRHWNKHGL